MFFLPIFNQLNDFIRLLCSMHTKRMVYVYTHTYAHSIYCQHQFDLHIEIFNSLSHSDSAVNVRRFITMWRYLSQSKLCVQQPENDKKKPNRKFVLVIIKLAVILNATSVVFIQPGNNLLATVATTTIKSSIN